MWSTAQGNRIPFVFEEAVLRAGPPLMTQMHRHRLEILPRTRPNLIQSVPEKAIEQGFRLLQSSVPPLCRACCLPGKSVQV